MLDVVREGLEWASNAQFAVSFTRCSGLGLLVDPLRELIERKGRVQLLTSTYMNVTQPEALTSLIRLKGVETFVQSGPQGFHSKFWLFDGDKRGECWAGSSNISKGGLIENLEWNLCSTDPSTLSLTRKQFQSLLARDDVRPLTHALIDDYTLLYESTPPLKLPMAAEGPGLAPLRPNAAQIEALQRLSEFRSQGLKRAAIIAATGIGKTYLAAFDVLQMKARSVLFISHRKEHLTQAERSFNRVLHDVDCHFATVQSLRTDPAPLRKKWDYLVIDEFHHVEAESYFPLRALRNNGHTFLLGLTATPERQDGHDILEWCDWNIAYEVRLPEAIERKWLLPFHYFAIADETIDFAAINWKRGMTPELEEALSIQRRVDLILEQALQYGFDGPKRATVGFCAGIKHAKFMADAFNQRGQHALAVWGQHEVEDREAVYDRLANPADPLQWLFVADVLNEGVDIPAINSLMFLRPTESSSIFLQQLGRGLRLTAGCEVLTVLDFVGHHRRAWMALQAISDVTNTGRAVEVGDFVVKPPGSCEVILQRKTLEMLEKINRHTRKRDALREQCSNLYLEIKAELENERAPLPVDLWQRVGAPTLSEFRSAYGDWLALQAAHGDVPTWAQKLEPDDLPRSFLRSLEKDWQLQRVHAHATLCGLAGGEQSFESAYATFFREHPQWLVEREDPFPRDSVHGTFENELDQGELVGQRFAAAITRRIPAADLRKEVEGRLLYWTQLAFEERHGGFVRSPRELVLHRQYRRRDVVRYFGKRHDPTVHNKAVLRFDTHKAIVLVVKLDTTNAKREHHYTNRFIDESKFEWASQNQMRQDNDRGRFVLDHEQNGYAIHLFLQPHSHATATYLGRMRVLDVQGNAPMQVTLGFESTVPSSLRKSIEAEAE